jgi:hypothetical protein
MSSTGFGKVITGIAALIFSVVAGGRIFCAGALCHFNIIELVWIGLCQRAYKCAG